MSLGPEHAGRRIAVVGAGWAGLAAAFTLKSAGWHTQVFEQSPVLGGRARKAVIPRRGVTLDNGQHLMLGAYRHVLALMQDIGVDIDHTLLRLPLQLTTLDGSLNLTVNAAHPGALRLPLALLKMKGASAGQKYILVRALLQLQWSAWRVPPGTTVLTWLRKHRQPAALIRLFWEPLCIATLNTPIADACMSLFAVVLRDSLASGAQASDLIVPRVDLSALWPEVLAPELTIHTNTPVRGISLVPGGYRLHTDSLHRTGQDNSRQDNPDQHDDTGVYPLDFDAVILATPAPVCRRLLWPLRHNSESNQSSESIPRNNTDAAERGTCRQARPTTTAKSALLEQLDAFRYHAIATLTVFLEAPFPLSGCMYMLKENRETGFDGQWLFNRSRFMHPATAAPAPIANHTSETGQAAGATPDATSHAICVVISHADHLIGADRDNIASAILAQVRSQLPTGVMLPRTLGYELIMEKRATFAATAGLARPDNITPWPGLFLAGDWTDTGYPGVLEGAVMSGLAAAKAAQASCGQRKPDNC